MYLCIQAIFSLPNPTALSDGTKIPATHPDEQKGSTIVQHPCRGIEKMEIIHVTG